MLKISYVKSNIRIHKRSQKIGDKKNGKFRPHHFRYDLLQSKPWIPT